MAKGRHHPHQQQVETHTEDTTFEAKDTIFGDFSFSSDNPAIIWAVVGIVIMIVVSTLFIPSLIRLIKAISKMLKKVHHKYKRKK